MYKLHIFIHLFIKKTQKVIVRVIMLFEGVSKYLLLAVLAFHGTVRAELTENQQYAPNYEHSNNHVHHHHSVHQNLDHQSTDQMHHSHHQGHSSHKGQQHLMNTDSYSDNRPHNNYNDYPESSNSAEAKSYHETHGGSYQGPNGVYGGHNNLAIPYHPEFNPTSSVKISSEELDAEEKKERREQGRADDELPSFTS